MAVIGLNKVRVQNALVSAGKAGEFYVLPVDPSTGLFGLGSPPKTAAPTSVNANETRSTYGPSKTNHMTAPDDRTSWFWELRLQFAQHVALEKFEESCSKTPIALFRDPANGFDRQVILHFRNAVYKHPPEQQPAQGTQVVYLFEATLSPL